ncbi:S-adenosyl-L-methionine-dependent methyltransferase [Aulographum hederae CBS 113979]|uniref:S-adenosyl-L-methionine-dependent methyltransferase n=1 Tax=Aulographum hederae CBS 113979 TaxID=1176131 RepID=A0A6G1GML4_9PEZI|nr:S-adenosyl-L-methionine-dependent methyltransferase [Aulographum hederae CBS 113979]
MPLFQNSRSGVQNYEQDPRAIAVDTYTATHLHNDTALNKALNHCISNSADNGLRDIAVFPAFGKFLMLQARLARASHILEVGLLGGYSTIWMAFANPEVKITTLEIDEHAAEVAKKNFEVAGVASRIEVLVGTALDILPTLEKEIQEGKREKYGLAFIDADKENNWSYFDYAAKMSAGTGSVIVVDNVVRAGAVADEEEAKKDERVAGTRKVIENAGRDGRVDATVVQTVGEKSYDGFLLAYVK